MAELVDALASGASGRKAVEVRVLFWAPKNNFWHLFLLWPELQAGQEIVD
jgi:hypothetical protein